jgi:exosortase
MSQTFRLTYALPVLTISALIPLFAFWGNVSNPAMESRSIFQWFFNQWRNAGGDFSHGWMMPLISGGIVAWKWRELREAPKSVSRRGLIYTLLLLLLHLAAYRAQQPRISAAAFTGLLWAVPYHLYGPRVAALLRFPAAYLLLCVMSYFLVNFTFQLRLGTSMLSAWLLNGIGIAAQRSGTAIYAAAGGGFQFDVADPCSGLRSLVVMTALAAPYAYFTQKTPGRQWTLFIAAVPLAAMANILRIVTIAVVAEVFGQENAMKLYHDFSGYLVFIIATLLLAGTGRLLEIPFKEKIKSWTARVSKPA